MENTQQNNQTLSHPLNGVWVAAVQIFTLRGTPFNIVIAGRAAKRWTNACHFCPRHFSAVSRHDRLQSGCDKRCTHVERGDAKGSCVPKTNDSGTKLLYLEHGDFAGEIRSRTRASINVPKHHPTRAFGTLSHRDSLMTAAKKLARNQAYTDTSTA